MRILKNICEIAVIFGCLLLIVGIVGFLSGCVNVAHARASKPPVTESTPKPSPTPSPKSEAPAEPDSVYLAWDVKPEGKQWSAVLLKSIDTNWQELKKAGDIADFCANWETLSEAKKKEVFAELMIAIAYYESGWSPVSRMKETTMGIDPITKLPVYSEGLFQLSYQDEQWIKCGFDWEKDKTLSPEDPKKTILNPALNIDCAVRIMARQIKNKGEVLLFSGVYWAVIKQMGRYQKIDGIKNRVKLNVSACK